MAWFDVDVEQVIRVRQTVRFEAATDAAAETRVRQELYNEHWISDLYKRLDERDWDEPRVYVRGVTELETVEHSNRLAR